MAVFFANKASGLAIVTTSRPLRTKKLFPPTTTPRRTWVKADEVANVALPVASWEELSPPEDY